FQERPMLCLPFTSGASRATLPPRSVAALVPYNILGVRARGKADKIVTSARENRAKNDFEPFPGSKSSKLGQEAHLQGHEFNSVRSRAVRRNRKEAKRRQETIQVWTYEQARRALPYVASIMRSLREHRLEAQQQRQTAERLANQPGRPTREMLISEKD